LPSDAGADFFTALRRDAVRSMFPGRDRRLGLAASAGYSVRHLWL